MINSQEILGFISAFCNDCVSQTPEEASIDRAMTGHVLRDWLSQSNMIRNRLGVQAYAKVSGLIQKSKKFLSDADSSEAAVFLPSYQPDDAMMLVDRYVPLRSKYLAYDSPESTNYTRILNSVSDLLTDKDHCSVDASRKLAYELGSALAATSAVNRRDDIIRYFVCGLLDGL